MRDTAAVVSAVSQAKEMVWINPKYLMFELTDALCQLVVSDEDIDDAEKRLQRFAPFIQKKFPETAPTHGIIESELVAIPMMQSALEKEYGVSIPGKLLMKMDSHLPIAGSVKARGGIYEVLTHAENLALANGMISRDESYEKFADDELQNFFHDYTMQVGSTGNLGISVGIMSAAFGFNTIVHMSKDAKAWKKSLLRSHGVKVIEYDDDYAKAVAEGRRQSELNPMSYFVDDEKSVDLFLGYATAAKRLKKQLDEKNIVVDEEHPLLVYIPAGIGGAPWGISYGLKRVYKDNVHCFFCEPTQWPSVLLGMATGKMEKANIKDYGLTGSTHADGLACPSPSSFVTRIMMNLLSGDFTVEDAKLYDFLRLLYRAEGKEIEPSSCAAFVGPLRLLELEDSREYLSSHGLTREILDHSTQIVWATGGSMVPEEVKKQYRNTYL